MKLPAVSRFVGGLCLALALGTPAHANLTYQYTGLPFTTIDDPAIGHSVTASVTFDATVTPGFTGTVGAAHAVTWELSSGPITVHPISFPASNLTAMSFVFVTGNITSWAFGATSAFNLGSCAIVACIDTFNMPPSGGGVFDDVILGRFDVPTLRNANAGAPGVWSLPAVPEPGSWALFALGLTVLGVVLRRPVPC